MSSRDSKLISKRVTIIVAASLVFVLCATIWIVRSPAEPAYGGKPLTVWLEEIKKLDYREQRATNYASVRAVRAIGTNAIPWLLSELRADGSKWHWRANQILKKQNIIKFRFPDVNERLSRAIVGFRALGELGAPAIPELLKLVDTTVGYTPGALACIGVPAIPALRQCLTNPMQIQTSVGLIMPCPGNTIGAIHNECLNFGHIPVSEIAVLIPTIRMVAQSSNQHAAIYATNFLNAYEQRLSETAANAGRSTP